MQSGLQARQEQLFDHADGCATILVKLDATDVDVQMREDACFDLG